MKTSCVAHPAGESFIQVHKWQLEYTDGNRCAAFLLSLFEHWHNCALAMMSRGQRDSPWQWHKITDLVDELLGFYKRDAIIEAIALLVGKTAIKTMQLDAYDRTTHYLFQPEVINDWLASRSRLNGHSRKNRPWKVGKTDHLARASSLTSYEVSNRDNATKTLDQDASRVARGSDSDPASHPKTKGSKHPKTKSSSETSSSQDPPNGSAPPKRRRHWLPYGQERRPKSKAVFRKFCEERGIDWDTMGDYQWQVLRDRDWTHDTTGKPLKSWRAYMVKVQRNWDDPDFYWDADHRWKRQAQELN
jgi:hypothetical protein